MKRALIAAGALLLVAALAACQDDLERQSRVSKLRVLAVRAEPAELVYDPAQPPPSTILTALAVDKASGTPITLRFALCTTLTDAPSPSLPCPGSGGIDLPDAGASAARLALDDPRILAFAAAADGGFADAGAALAAGIPLLVGFTASATLPDGGPERLQGFDTVKLRTGGPSNVNPELHALQLAEELDGGALGTAVELAPETTVRAAATYRLTPVAGTKDDPSKRYGFSFFATGGTISSLRSTDVTATGEPANIWVDWTAPADPGAVRFWVVLRDGRSGTAWLERSATVQ